MRHTKVTLHTGATIAVVLVAPGQAVARTGDYLLRQLQPNFSNLPIMLIERDDTVPMGVRAYATFQWHGYLVEFMMKRHIEWDDLPPIPEQEPPF